MKKFSVLIVMLFVFTASLFAFSYPLSFKELIEQFEETNQSIEIVLVTEKEYEGVVILARDDYFVFRLMNDDVIIILYSAVAEVTLIGD